MGQGKKAWETNKMSDSNTRARAREGKWKRSSEYAATDFSLT